MNLPIQCKRLRQVREELNHTQSSFAEVLGVGNSTTEYERGRTKITGELVLRLLSDFNINPLWLYGESKQKHLDPRAKEASPSVVTVDSTGFENILMVSQKAAAGYAGNLDDQEYHKQLPAFAFPIPEYRNATFRCFQVEGYSMSPTILPDEWIITKALENLGQIKNNNIYVIVDTEGIRVKQVFNDAKTRQLALVSINKEYEQEFLEYDKVMEVWEFHSKITKELVVDAEQYKLDTIFNDIKEIKDRIIGGNE